MTIESDIQSEMTQTELALVVDAIASWILNGITGETTKNIHIRNVKKGTHGSTESE